MTVRWIPAKVFSHWARDEHDQLVYPHVAEEDPVAVPVPFVPMPVWDSTAVLLYVNERGEPVTYDNEAGLTLMPGITSGYDTWDNAIEQARHWIAGTQPPEPQLPEPDLDLIHTRGEGKQRYSK